MQTQEVKMSLLPPTQDKCQKCAVDHEEDIPHDQTSLYWQTWFYLQHRRQPTWRDAMAHCTDEVKQQWIIALQEHGIEIETEAV